MDQDKIDLSSVNKQKKQVKLPKLKNPFKKQSGPNRDELGKFSGGSGGLFKSKNFNWKRAAPLIAIVALVGGLFVFRSFAGTKLYAYQYSVAKCSVTGSTSRGEDTTCQDKSAEALVYRMYRATSNRNPETGGYKFWTQKLAGDRVKTGRVADEFVAAKSIANKTNQKFVDDLYTNLQLNNDPKGKAYWVGVLNDKSWSRGKVLAHFTTLSDVITKNFAATATFLSSAPKVTITETAKKKQQERADKALVYATVSKSQYDGVKGYVASARTIRNTAMNQANKAAPSKADLTAIATNEKEIRNYLTKTNSPLDKINSNQKSLQILATEAANVAKYSPDLSDSAVKTQLDKGAASVKAIGTVRSDLNYLIKQVGDGYKSAEGKYEAERARLEAIEAAKCKTGTDYNGSAPGCGSAPAPNGGGKGGGGQVYSYPSSQNCNYSGGGWSMRTAPIEAEPSRNKYRCIKPGVAAKSAILTCYSSYEKIVMNDGWTACRLKHTSLR